MNQFFGTQYSKEDLQQRVALRRQTSHNVRSMSLSTPTHDDKTMDIPDIPGGDSLDDIIMQNSKEVQRRQSFPQHYPEAQPHDRRPSMLEFGSSNREIGDFQFATPTATNSMSPQHSVGELDLSGYGDLTSSMLNESGFTTSMQTNVPLALDTGGSFQGIHTDIMGNYMGFPSMGIEGMDGDDQQMGLFEANNFSTPEFTQAITSMPSNFSMPIASSMDMGGNSTIAAPSGHDDEMLSGVPGLTISDPSIQQGPGFVQDIRQNIFNVNSNKGQMPTVSESVRTATTVGPAQVEPKQSVDNNQPSFRNVYSSSGFDMLGALMRVATRKNPEINIGAVDMSCAFVVCDVTQVDCPIVYVSDIFERLTGYNKHEVLGRNCRFLQAPDGKVMTGVKRKYVDDDSVFYLKRQIGQSKEAQRSLINYRKGGQPFMNLLTMIPITWDSDDVKYYVGFQVDLVEQPGSVAGKGSGGSYTVNYSQSSLPRYTFQPPEPSQNQQGSGHTMSRDDVSSVLKSAVNGGPSDMAKRVWDKVLLENSDDVVHVLSLKGLFLYLSPSSKRVLEYDASELVGTALSSVCHPSDIVPVTRELKDTSTGATVNVVFRIRRKKSGYTWFESHGSLCVEQGKGRKCIILVGRERPVYTLGRLDIENVGGIGENELWTKLSTSGMFLFVSSNVRALLDRQPDELIGTSIQALMRPESKAEFGRCLERVRTGKRVMFKHEIMNKRGQILQAQTSMYPGDASEGTKPTFLVGQTRLLKATRVTTPAIQSSKSVASNSKVVVIDNNGPATPQSPSTISLDEKTPQRYYDGIITQAGGGGLAIGSQDAALASEDNIFDELKTTRCTSWQFELRQMEKSNRLLSEELASLLSSRKKRKRRKGAGNLQRDCANCHTRVTPEWRRGPSGQRDLCNSCGLRWAKTTGRVSPRRSSRRSDGDAGSKHSASPQHSSPLQQEVLSSKLASHSSTPNLNPTPTQHAHPSAKPVFNSDLSNGGVTVAGTTDYSDLADTNGEKRSTTNSHPAHNPRQGFKNGVSNGITKIDEADEAS